MSTNIEFVILVYHRMENRCKGHFARKNRPFSPANFCKTIGRQGRCLPGKFRKIAGRSALLFLSYGATFVIYPVQTPGIAL
jgi:hypothetical protein